MEDKESRFCAVVADAIRVEEFLSMYKSAKAKKPSLFHWLGDEAGTISADSKRTGWAEAMLSQSV